VNNNSILLAALLVATAGAFLQIGGVSWDVTSHILREPETFFTASHTVLYAGAGLAAIASGIGGAVLLKSRELHSRSLYTAFKLLIIGSAIELVSGPGDFMWHEAFGVDGLMSPPHLALATGILVNAVAAVVGLARITPYMHSSRQTLARAAMVPAFAALWFSAIWYIYMFVLPLSNGENFQFNPDPAAAVVIATIALPLVSAMIFTVSARTIGRLGAASAVTAVVIGMNVFANIVPAQQHLMPFLLWYLLTIIPAIGADIAVNRAGPKMGAIIIPGALIGMAFYVFNFPMLPMTFAALLSMPNQSISDVLPSTHATLSQAVTMTAIPGALAGVIGAIIASKKIKMPQVIEAVSR
jgi:hypothetical protein